MLVITSLVQNADSTFCNHADKCLVKLCLETTDQNQDRPMVLRFYLLKLAVFFFSDLEGTNGIFINFSNYVFIFASSPNCFAHAGGFLMDTVGCFVRGGIFHDLVLPVSF